MQMMAPKLANQRGCARGSELHMRVIPYGLAQLDLTATEMKRTMTHTNVLMIKVTKMMVAIAMLATMACEGETERR